MHIFKNILKNKKNNSVQPQNEYKAKSYIIRDFIYLDIERIRSYVAQFYGGLTTQRTSNQEIKDSVSGSIKAGVPLGLNVSADVERYLLKSNQETKSLHDQIFDQFYQALLSTKSLRNMEEINPDTWDKSIFNDGSFLSVKSAITITDYNYVSHFAKKLQEMTSNLSRTAAASSNIEHKKQAISNLKDIEKIPTKDIANLIDEFYGNIVRIDFFPFKENTEKIFIGTADLELFRLNIKNILTFYGPTIDAGWNSILQVNIGKYPKNKILVGHTGNEMDIAIKQVVSAISAVLNTTQTINFPAVSVIPIAIFRDTSLG